MIFSLAQGLVVEQHQHYSYITNRVDEIQVKGLPCQECTTPPDINLMFRYWLVTAYDVGCWLHSGISSTVTPTMTTVSHQPLHYLQTSHLKPSFVGQSSHDLLTASCSDFVCFWNWFFYMSRPQTSSGACITSSITCVILKAILRWVWFRVWTSALVAACASAFIVWIILRTLILWKVATVFNLRTSKQHVYIAHLPTHECRRWPMRTINVAYLPLGMSMPGYSHRLYGYNCNCRSKLWVTADFGHA